MRRRLQDEDEVEEVEDLDAFEGGEESPRPRRPRIEILHHDESLVVIAKPAGLWPDVMAGEESSVAEQLVKANLLEDGPDPLFIYPVDPPVSGALLMARNEAVAKTLRKQAEDGGLELTLRAIVRGPIMNPSGVIDFKLSGLGHGPTARMRVDAIRGHEARTTWTVKDQFVGFAVVECQARPLYPHQVRAHLEAAGMPLAVDPLYSGATHLMLSSFKAGYRRSRRHAERPLIDRVSLHVASVAFVHPASGQPCRFECPMPKDFRATLHQLDRFGRMPK